jgi:hypothetical protein
LANDFGKNLMMMLERKSHYSSTWISFILLLPVFPLFETVKFSEYNIPVFGESIDSSSYYYFATMLQCWNFGSNIKKLENGQVYLAEVLEQSVDRTKASYQLFNT